MSTTTNKLKSLKEFFGADSSRRCGETFGDPVWLKELRKKGLQAWTQGLEKSETSGARFVKELHTVALRQFDTGEKLAIPEKNNAALKSHWGQLEGCAVYGCEETQDVLLSEEAKKQGVRFLSMKDAIAQDSEKMKKLLFSRTAVEESRYTALHAAYFGQGAVLFVPKGVKLIKPIIMRGIHTGGHAGFFPHTLVVLEEGAEATVVEEFYSAGESAGLVSGISELVVAPSAQLNYVSVQSVNDKSVVTLHQNTNLGRESYLYTLGIITGGLQSCSYLGSTLAGEAARVDLLGLILGKGNQQIEIRTLQDHRARAGESDALVKSILRGKAKSYFDGVVKIPPTGQQSNAFQSNPNLLLSSDARAESIPTLEIEADDVACKHAASIGSIDEDERFYLLSRGIPMEDTEAMIVEGFAAELAQRLPNAELQERFEEILNGLTQKHAREI